MAIQMTERFQAPHEKLLSYVYLAEPSYKNENPRFFIYLDSAFSKMNMIDFGAIPFQWDARYNLMALLEKIGGEKMNTLAFEIFRDIPEGPKFFGILRMVDGMAAEGNYYRSLTMIPSTLTEEQDLISCSIIVWEACKKREREAGIKDWVSMDYTFRFDGQIPPLYAETMRSGLPLVCGIYLLGLWLFGIHRGLWRYVGLHDLGRILWACVASTVVTFVLVHPILGRVEYPRSVILGTGLLAGLYLAGIRLIVRWFREWLQIVGPTARRVLIVGAGNAGELLVRNMQMDPSHNYRPVAFVDDDLGQARGENPRGPSSGKYTKYQASRGSL